MTEMTQEHWHRLGKSNIGCSELQVRPDSQNLEQIIKRVLITLNVFRNTLNV